MNPTRYSPDARTTECIVNDTPADCEHCGLLNTPAVAAVYWESATSTAFGYSEACGPCLPRVVDDAIADSYPNARVTVERFIVEPISTHGRLHMPTVAA